MILRRMTENGIEKFENYLIDLKIDSSAVPPFELLTDTEHSEEIVPKIDIAKQSFESRLEAAEYLSTSFEELEKSHDVLRDAGLWVWLTLYYFDQVCPLGANGTRIIRELACYIPYTRNYQRYYRHFLAGPYRIYRAHRTSPEITLALLCNPLHKSGEVFGQLASVQGILTAPGAMEAITKLYYNPATAGVKSGAGGKNPGSARRLRDFLNQIDLTWDLYSIQSSQLLNLLPREFQKFR